MLSCLLTQLSSSILISSGRIRVSLHYSLFNGVKTKANASGKDDKASAPNIFASRSWKRSFICQVAARPGLIDTPRFYGIIKTTPWRMAENYRRGAACFSHFFADAITSRMNFKETYWTVSIALINSHSGRHCYVPIYHFLLIFCCELNITVSKQPEYVI